MPRYTVRLGALEDAPALVRVKRRLRVPARQEAPRGGFLLGTSSQRYRHMLQNDYVDVVEDEHKHLAGFSIVLRDESLRQGDLYERRREARLDAARLDELLAVRLAYFEQLAFLPDPACRVYAKYAAFSGLLRAFGAHDAVLATVVRRPIYNQAALPFLEVIGFQRIGDLDEHHPQVGSLLSDIYLLDHATFIVNLERPLLRAFRAKGERGAISRPEPVG
jgi:hypothetical protein